MHRLFSVLARRGSALSLMTALVLVATLVPVSSGSALGGRAQAAGIVPLAVRGPSVPLQNPSAADSFCRTYIGYACYTPFEIWNAYGVSSLLHAGFNGAGQTIVIFDSYGSPTMSTDLATFDTAFGLAAPPSLTVLSPLGTVPFDDTNCTQVGWAEETSLDVQWAHAMAPGANIVVMTSPVAETEGVAGMPEMFLLEQYALQNSVGQVWSQSWAATENTLFNADGFSVLQEMNTQYQLAGQSGISVFASSGDTGPANLETNQTTNYPFPTVNFPTSSPYVTSVGGTNLFATTIGTYQSERVWNDGYGADGGGLSQYWSEPSYQLTYLPPVNQQQLRGWRGVPDVSYNAGVVTSVLVYLGFTSSDCGIVPGYYLFGGTSAGSPQWSGITADLNQAIGAPLGFLNPLLYSIGASNQSAVFHDVKVGNNSFDGITGYQSMPGWDLASGWGSPNVGLLTSIISAAKARSATK